MAMGGTRLGSSIQAPSAEGCIRIKFGHALDRLLREILLANPDLGPVYMMKVDIADGFYRINLTIDEWCCLPCCGRGDGFNYLFLAMGSANEYEPLATWCNTNWPQEESAHFY